MTEGMQLLLARAFETLRLHRVEANIQPGNERSLALASGSGFVREGLSERYLKVSGRWRDHERWAIRVEQWNPSISVDTSRQGTTAAFRIDA
jgi:[ribosomal protein S5]-alanine N-acetyltransferase